MRYYFTPIKVAIIEKWTRPNAGKDAETLESLYTDNIVH